MSRRDTIIIAVLVNAALLMILFATAIRSGDSKEAIQKKASAADLAEAPPLPPSPSLHDELLNEFVTPMPTLADAGTEIVFPFEEREIAMTHIPAPVLPIEMYPPSAPTPIAAAPSPAVSTPKADSQIVNVTVKKGDYLEKIAKANNTTVAAIMKTNNMTSTALKIGQVLKVPLTQGDKKPASTSPQTVPAATSGAEFYVVKEGDNPWLIASRNKINLEELLRLNGLDDQKAKRLRPGDKLKIR